MERNETADGSDLFSPSLEGRSASARAAGERPWRLGSQFYVAFFGGVLAVTAIAWLNAGRLGLEESRRRLILLVGALGLVGVVVLLVVLDATASDSLRLAGRLVGVLAFGVLYALQKPADRVYSAFAPGDGEKEHYDPLWVPGLVAVVVLGLLQAALVAGALTLL